MKLSKKDTILLAVIALVAGIGGFYWFYVKPASKDLQAKQDEVVAVQAQNDGLRDTVSRLEAGAKSLSGLSSERLRYAKAVPDSADVPAAIYQIQRIADRANVEFTSISTQDVTELGGFAGRGFQMKVKGKFFDVDDFLYRLHRQVTVDAKGRAAISGRLFAVTKVEMTVAERTDSAAGTRLKKGDEVQATLDVVAFSTPRGGAAATTPTTATSGIVSPNVGQASAATTGGTP